MTSLSLHARIYDGFQRFRARVRACASVCVCSARYGNGCHPPGRFARHSYSDPREEFLLNQPNLANGLAFIKPLLIRRDTTAFSVSLHTTPACVRTFAFFLRLLRESVLPNSREVSEKRARPRFLNEARANRNPFHRFPLGMPVKRSSREDRDSEAPEHSGGN